MMVPKKSLLCAGLALAGFAMSANAQTTEVLDSTSFKRITPIKHMVYDFANRKVIRNGTPQKRAIATFCYINTDTVGFFTSISPTSEFIDWGILGSSTGGQAGAMGCTPLSPILTNFNFAYASSTPDTSVGGPGAALTLSFYTSWLGFGADSGNCPVATFAFSGLPGFSGSSTGIGSAYGFTVDLSGGSEFCMPDGQFGYGYRGDFNTGPLLCLTGDGAGGLEASTGNNDVFDIWSPDTKGVNVGSFFFGGPPQNFSSWYGQLARADLSGSPAMVATRNAPPNQAGSLVSNAPVLGETLNIAGSDALGYLACIVIAFDTPFTLTLGGGQTLLCIDFGGSGEILTGAGFGLTPDPMNPGLFGPDSLPLPKNVDLCGFSFCMQGLLAFGTVPFALTSAVDVTVGG